MKLYIYGAQGYALGAYEALKSTYPERPVSAFLITKKGNDPETLAGLPVLTIDSFSSGMSPDEKNDTEVMIATPENVFHEIEKTLEKHGFIHYKRLDYERLSRLLDLFHMKSGDFLPLSSLPAGCSSPDLSVFMAMSHKDRPLKKDYVRPGFIHPIQAGAANTDERIADLADNTGENISRKNVNYSEISALYWVWKNRLLRDKPGEYDYYGLFQYRRIYDFTEEDLRKLKDNDVDVVLPFPLPYEPDINAHHERYLKKVDWNALLKALGELQPEYADAFPEILSQKYLYNYNVIVAKREVLTDYCEWLFPVLFLTEELSEPKGEDRADRYIGYMAETLETLYFMKNKGKLKIVHKNCRLLV